MSDAIVRALNYSIENGRWAAVLCFLFTTFLLFSIIAPGDGTWFLYANSISNGQRMYADLHLNQQPLFPLITLLVHDIAGDVFVLQKLGYLVIPFLFVYYIYKISQHFNQSDGFKALIIILLFITAISFNAYRFEDYHPLSGVLILASIFYAFKLSAKQLSPLRYVFIQSLIIGLLLNVRLNDGIFLAAAVLFFSFYTIGFNRYLVYGLLLSMISHWLVLSLCLLALGDSYHDWLFNSIISASKIKGGGALLTYPGMLFINAFRALSNALLSNKVVIYLMFWFCLIHLSINYFRGFVKHTFLLFALLGISSLFSNALNLSFMWFMVAIGAIVSFLIALWLMVKLSIKLLNWHNRSSIVLKPHAGLYFFPFFLFCGGSLSSAGAYTDHYFPLTTLFIALLMVYQNRQFTNKLAITFKFICLFALIVFAAKALLKKIDKPYYWHSYNVPPIYQPLVFKNDPLHGSHFISQPLANLITPVCNIVKDSDELLSIPFSFANYYCNKTPWKFYVQTFFDTSSPERIKQLIADLNQPPKYIFYQRQIENLTFHEQRFNKGKPLKQRELDALIKHKVNNKEWKVVFASREFAPSKWYLIQTHD